MVKRNEFFDKIVGKIGGDYKEELINTSTYNAYYNAKIDEKLIYIESKNGKDFLSNLLCIVRELSKEDYKDFKIFTYANKKVKPKIEELQKTHNLKINKIITKESEALKTSEKAKYIITDSYVHKKYVKRPEQTLVYLWNEIPLMNIGKDNIKKQHKIAHIQQTILSSDYLIFPNEYCKEKVLNAYMMEKIYPGTILLEEHPRTNQTDDNIKDRIENKLNLKDKDVIAYVFNKKRKGNLHKDIENTLNELEKSLADNQILLVKLHKHNQSKIEFNEFKHIKPFPQEYDVYEVLNCSNTLITDYSNILFDFANRGKVIIYNYDPNPFENNETYIPLEDIPFPQINNIEDLINEINSPKEYDNKEFIEKYGQSLKSDSAKNICKHIFKGENVCKEEKIENNKENILIFGGGLFNNGITSSLLNLLNSIDRTKYNIFLSFYQWSEYVETHHELIYEMMPEGIEFLPLRSEFNLTLREKKQYEKFLYSEKEKACPKSIDNMLKREFNRQYPGNLFKSVVNFDGYGKDTNLMFSRADAKTTIWVHSDMLQEIETRENQNMNILKDCYNNYDNVSVVSSSLIQPTKTISGRDDNIHLVHNINNYKAIQENSKKDIYINKNTEIITSNPEGIEGVLEKPGKKIITIGRFSPEKGHINLINAFDRLYEDYPDTQLIIIGGHGPLYHKTKELRKNLKSCENITLIKWISNPMPILNECDLFVFPSFYEGWGMVLMEADTLEVPVIATDIKGTQWVGKYNGYLAENSVEGLLKGLYDFMNGKVSKLDINYEEYNKKAIKEFYSIL